MSVLTDIEPLGISMHYICIDQIHSQFACCDYLYLITYFHFFFSRIIMASSFFSNISNITELEQYKLNEKLKKYTYYSHSGCDIWQGRQDRSGYGELRFSFREKNVCLKIHRVVYALRNPGIVLSRNWHVSHLCHNRQCVTYQHLSYEPQAINNNRKVCNNNGECSGHYGYRNCLL